MKSCGNRYNHKLVDMAFYSIDKMPCEIKKKDILNAIKLDHELLEGKREIDEDDRVIKIEKDKVYWNPSSDNYEAVLTSSNIAKLLKILQS